MCEIVRKCVCVIMKYNQVCVRECLLYQLLLGVCNRKGCHVIRESSCDRMNRSSPENITNTCSHNSPETPQRQVCMFFISVFGWKVFCNVLSWSDQLRLLKRLKILIRALNVVNTKLCEHFNYTYRICNAKIYTIIYQTKLHFL